jgi:hypothetical protein
MHVLQWDYSLIPATTRDACLRICFCLVSVLAMKYEHSVRKSTLSGTIIISFHNFVIVITVYFCLICCLGGVIVSMLLLDPRFMGSDPTEVMDF